MLTWIWVELQLTPHQTQTEWTRKMSFVHGFQLGAQKFTIYLIVGKSLCICCPEREVFNDYQFAGTKSKILVDKDPVKTPFKEQTKPDHFLRKSYQEKEGL